MSKHGVSVQVQRNVYIGLLFFQFPDFDAILFINWFFVSRRGAFLHEIVTFDYLYGIWMAINQRPMIGILGLPGLFALSGQSGYDWSREKLNGDNFNAWVLNMADMFNQADYIQPLISRVSQYTKIEVKAVNVDDCSHFPCPRNEKTARRRSFRPTVKPT